MDPQVDLSCHIGCRILPIHENTCQIAITTLLHDQRHGLVHGRPLRVLSPFLFCICDCCFPILASRRNVVANCLHDTVWDIELVKRVCVDTIISSVAELQTSVAVGRVAVIGRVVVVAVAVVAAAA